MSRAACSAMVASLACSEPQCLCASPLRLRMKTFHSGVFGVAIIASSSRGLRRGSLSSFLGMGSGSLAHPGAVLMRLPARRQPFAIAGAVAGEHLLELRPVDRAVAPMSVRILGHAGIGNGQPEILRLRDGGIDEFLPKLVIGE